MTLSSLINSYLLTGGGKPFSLSEEEQLSRAIRESEQMQQSIVQKRKDACRAIRAKLDQSLVLQNILGDGNCMFRALARVYNQIHFFRPYT